MNRNQLTLANRQGNRYRLQDAEKDYHLAEAVKIIAESPLAEKIVFKGGTAIHHCYLPQQRFSEDLDFSSLDKSVSMDEVVATLESTGDFVVKKKFESNATVKVERLVYQGVLDQPGSIKVEIDRLQNVVLPAVEKRYENPYGIEATIKTMQLDEILSEKIRATSNRARYRDFYDLILLLQDDRTDFERSLELAKRKEIRALVSPEEIQANWLQALEQSEKEKRAMYMQPSVTDADIQTLIDGFTFDPIYPPSDD